MDGSIVCTWGWHRGRIPSDTSRYAPTPNPSTHATLRILLTASDTGCSAAESLRSTGVPPNGNAFEVLEPCDAKVSGTVPRDVSDHGEDAHEGAEGPLTDPVTPGPQSVILGE
jgi:hypothetical protein